MTQPIADYDVVVLVRDLPEVGLKQGQTGTIVMTHEVGVAFEVEFILDPELQSSSVVATVRAEDLLLEIKA